MLCLSVSALLVAAASIASAAPALTARQNVCFVVGSKTLPQEVVNSVNQIANSVTCNTAVKTIDGVPDVTSGGVSFSSINFATSGKTPLGFALSKFATTEPLANNDLALFQNELNVYLATEAGLRSVGGNLNVKVPKFFLQFQIARIQTAKGNPPTSASDTVQHQLGKVLKNAASESQSLLDQVNKLATTLS